MPAARRSSKQAPRSPSLAPALAGIGCVAAVPLLWFGLPGLVVTWALLLVASWSAAPAEFSGKKDSAGYPTPASPAETQAMQRYRFWSDLKFRLIFAPSALLPGWPVYAAWLAGLWVAAAAWSLPYLDVVPYLESASRAIDAVFAFIIVTQVAAARRRTVVAGDTSPGVRIDALAGILRGDRREAALAALAGLGCALFGSALLGLYLPAPPVPVLGAATWYALGALGGLGAGLAYWWVRASLAEWRELVAAREEWAPRWQILKHDPAPFLTKREKIGNAVVDTFTAPSSMGALAYWPLSLKIIPTLGSGQRIVILSTPNVDSQGQPQQGTRHPLDFKIAAWPSDAMPSITDPGADPDEVGLLFEAAMTWTADAGGYARPMLDQAFPIAITAASESDLSEPSSGQPGESDSSDSEGADPESQVSPTQAWATTWLLPDGPPWTHVRSALAPGMAEHLGCEVLVDHRNGVLYAGALTAPETILDPQSGVSAESLQNLATEDKWNGRWGVVLKQDVNPPTVEHAVYAEATLPSGAVIHRQPFVTRQGVDPYDFFGLEPKIAATLGGAPFVAVGGWSSKGRVGERHPQAFVVYWASDAVPANPDLLPPPADASRRGRGPGRGRPAPRPRGAAEPQAQQWVLVGRIGEAFKAARLSRPEVYDVRCLTTSESPRHIWAISLRLYGGVTLADVRGAAERLRQALGSQWLRVEAAPDGCTLVVGANPTEAELANPERDEHYVASLDWEQAFLDSKVVGVGGITPTLSEVGRLPHNEQVQVLDFTLPPGLSFADVKAARTKLETASRNAFVSISEAPSGRADAFRVLSCETNPMPGSASVDFSVMDSADGIPFATGVEGEPVLFHPKDSPHALLAGVTGSGKAQPLTTPIPVPVSERFPTGWATIGDLRVGDAVYAADGAITRVNGLSPIEDQTTYRFVLSDGQVVESGSHHLWRVSTRASRREYTPSRSGLREGRRQAWDERVQGIRDKARDLGPEVVLSLPDISRIAGLGDTGIYRLPLSLNHLDFPMQVATDKVVATYCVEDIAVAIERRLERDSTLTLSGHQVTTGDVTVARKAGAVMGGRLTLAGCADALVGRHSTRDQRRALRAFVAGLALRTEPGRATATMTVYPADEVLTQIADHLAAAGPADKPHGARPALELVSSAEIAQRGVGERFAIARAAAIETGEAEDLPLDPYALGAWLGDGTQRHGSITSADPEVVEHVVAAGYPVRRVESRADQGAAETYHFEGLTEALRSAGLPVHRVRGCAKRIPAPYLRASFDQRLSLLQGLMDTDGSVGKTGSCSIDLCDDALAADVAELIRSLGIALAPRTAPATITEIIDGERVQRTCGERHRMTFTTALPVVRLPRKAERLPSDPASLRGTRQWAYVDRIEEAAAQPMRCISVEHPEHLYLTDQFVPTHNSVLITNFIFGFLVRGADVYVIDPVKGGADFAWAKDHCRAFASTPFEGAGVLREVYAEVTRRKTLNSEHGVASYLDLPEPPRPIVVVLDEFTSLMGKSPVPDSSEDAEVERERATLLAENQAKAIIGTFTGKLAREARSAGVTVLLGTQKLTAKMLDTVPGGADLKDLSLDTRLPVPVSDRFPNGWATVADLETGDRLYALDGTTTGIVGFSETYTTNDVYEVTFSDGHTIKAGADHGWLASDATSRRAFDRAVYGALDEGRLRTERVAEYEGLRDLAAILPGEFYATAEDLAALTDYRSGPAIERFATENRLGRFERAPGSQQVVPQRAAGRRGTRGRLYLVDDAIDRFASRRDVARLETHRGTWLTARAIAELVEGCPVTASRAGTYQTQMRESGCANKTGQHEPTLYDVVEVVTAIADHAKHRLGVDPRTGEPWTRERVVTTAEMARTVSVRDGRGWNWQIGLSEALTGQAVELPVDPYVLGAWLGDGSRNAAIFTSGRGPTCTGPDGITDQDHLIAQIRAAGYEAHPLRCSDQTVGTRGLLVDLRAAGVLGDKHIPAAYLRASFDQRLALLQGLMDTDGTVMSSGTCTIGQVDEHLAMQVRELVESLGARVGYSTWDARYRPDGADDYKVTGTYHSLSFTLRFPAFRLPRKISKQNLDPTGRVDSRSVVAVEKVPAEPTRCIAVDHPSHLFLVEGFIPTHNTNLARVLLGNASSGDRASAFRAPESAPPLTGGIPKGRGLWESLTASQAVMIQTWYASPADLAHHLRERVEPLPEAQRLDLTQFGPPELQVEGEILDDERLPGPGNRFVPGSSQPEVLDLGSVEFSLDDLEAELSGDEEPGSQNETVQSDPIERPSPGEQDETSTPGDTSPREVVWDAVNPAPYLPAAGSEYGWEEIDALLTFLDASPNVATISWANPHLDSLDDIGIPFRDVVADLLAERGVRLLGSDAPPETPAPPAPAESPAPPSAGSPDSEDEFGPLATVPAHLLPPPEDF